MGWWSKITGRDKRRKAEHNAKMMLYDEQARRQKLLDTAKQFYQQRLGDINNYDETFKGYIERLYNQGVANAARASENAENSIRRNMAQRGITGGYDLDSLVNKEYNNSKLISSLQANKANALAENTAKVADMRANANQNYYGNLYPLMTGTSPAAQNYQNVLESNAKKAGSIFNSALGGLAQVATGGGFGGLAGMFGVPTTFGNYMKTFNFR